MSSNKTIAKNTLFLYFRMFLTMGVGLYTSRLVLDALGVVDYGIYELVGGIVSMFAFLNSAMASATQRYLSFDIGKKDWDRLQETFNTTLNIHILIAIVIFILAETIGLWFVNTLLEIPEERMYAANWVYQFSIFAFLLNVIQVPYNALLFAREHMSVYAYVSILETVLKLAIVLYLVQADSDKLILYSILTFGVAFVIRMTYQIYCRKRFPESKYKFYWNKAYYKELMSYSGWNLFGNIAVIFRGLGSNILLNIFFGPVANASYAITMTVQGVISNFINSFQVAVNPQIVKRYSKGEIEDSMKLTLSASKYSFFGSTVLVFPILITISYLLELWLKEVPMYATGFIGVSLLILLVNAASEPMRTIVQATGNIKRYQIIISIIILSVFPFVYFVFSITKNPYYLFWVILINTIAVFIYRLWYLISKLDLKIKKAFDILILPCIKVIIPCFVIYYTLLNVEMHSTMIVDFILKVIVSSFLSLTLIYILGINKYERGLIHTYLNKALKKS